MAFDRCRLGWFEARSRKPTSKGLSFIFHTAPQTRRACVRDTPSPHFLLLGASEWLVRRGCSGGMLDFNFFVENGLAEFLKPSQWLRTTCETPYQHYE